MTSSAHEREQERGRDDEMSGVRRNVVARAGSGEAEAKRSEVRPGDVLAGRYAVHELLGAGGCAQVYEATDFVLGRPVALKVLRASSAEDGRATIASSTKRASSRAFGIRT